MFLLYTADIEKLIEQCGLSPYLYADDTQMFIRCRLGNTHLLRDTTLSCIFHIEDWMSSNRLKLNSVKTEFLWCTTHRRLHLIDESAFTIGNATIHPASGVLMDRDLSLRSDIARLTGACSKAPQQAPASRCSLTMNASRMLISSAVLSRSDYCNCIFAVPPDFNLDHLQQIMNAAARVIFRRRRNDHISDVLRTTRPPLAPSATTHRIQTVSHGVQGPTQPRTIVSS